MSLKITRVRLGSFRVVFEGELEPSQVRVARQDLAGILMEQPSQVEVRLHSMPSDSVSRGLLRSFFDILRARGCRVDLIGADESFLPVARLPS